MTWKLIGLDTFDGGTYPLGDFPTEQACRDAAKAKAEALDKSQPPKESGGQALFGIQDRLFIQAPDGTVTRYQW